MQNNLETENMENEESFGAWVGRVTFTFPLKLLGINLLFLLFCIPVATIPAALCALHAAIQRLYRETYYSSTVQCFTKAFMEAFVKRTTLIYGLVIGLIMIVVLLQNVLTPIVWLVAAAILVSCFLVVLSWLIPQLVFLNLTPSQALKNSLIFLSMETYRNFALIAIHAVSLTILVFGLPLTAFLLLVLPVLETVLVTGIVMPVLKKHLVQPEE